MKSRFTEEQIIKSIARVKNGETTRQVARDVGVSEHTLHVWKKKYADMTISEAKRMRELEHENSRLKKIVADMALDIAMLKEVNSKKW